MIEYEDGERELVSGPGGAGGESGGGRQSRDGANRKRLCPRDA